MRLTLTLTQADFAGFFRTLAPFRVDLGKEKGVQRWVEIDPPSELTVAEAALRVVTSARIRWNLAGIDVPVAISQLSFTLRLSIDPMDKGTLCFVPVLEEADLVNVPAFIDRGIVKVINHTLERTPIRWCFVDTLRFDPALPALISPETKLQIRAECGEIQPIDGAISLVIDGSIAARR